MITSSWKVVRSSLIISFIWICPLSECTSELLTNPNLYSNPENVTIATPNLTIATEEKRDNKGPYTQANVTIYPANGTLLYIFVFFLLIFKHKNHDRSQSVHLHVDLDCQDYDNFYIHIDVYIICVYTQPHV